LTLKYNLPPQLGNYKEKGVGGKAFPIGWANMYLPANFHNMLFVSKANGRIQGRRGRGRRGGLIFPVFMRIDIKCSMGYPMPELTSSL
jgi:hypothetical protein